MVDSRKFAALWLCAVFTLAIALGFVGIAILTDTISTDSRTTEQLRFGIQFWVAAVLFSGRYSELLDIVDTLQVYWSEQEMNPAGNKS
jgi:hypothetical protein